MLVNAIVFQAFAATLCITGASARSHSRRQLPGLDALPAMPKLPVPAPTGLLEPIASPLGKLESALFPGGITILPAVNTLVSKLSGVVSSALPVLAPVASDVTQLFPVSGSPTKKGGKGASPTAAPGLLDPLVSPVGSIVSDILPGGITILPAVNTLVSEVASVVSSVAPVLAPVASLATQIFPLSNSAAGPSGFSKTKKPSPHHPKPTATKKPSTKKPSTPKHTSKKAPKPKSTKGSSGSGSGDSGCGAAPAAPKPTAAPTPLCGPRFLPCLLEPVASLVKSIVPPITAFPAVNTLVSQVDAAVSSAVPELSTPKEITDKILPA
ncbi:hypothetical protein RQP46_004484 [Phenoliferia psychrophenolica]